MRLDPDGLERARQVREWQATKAAEETPTVRSIRLVKEQGASDMVKKIAEWAGDLNGWNDCGLEIAIRERFLRNDMEEYDADWEDLQMKSR